MVTGLGEVNNILQHNLVIFNSWLSDGFTDTRHGKCSQVRSERNVSLLQAELSDVIDDVVTDRFGFEACNLNTCQHVQIADDPQHWMCDESGQSRCFSEQFLPGRVLLIEHLLLFLIIRFGEFQKSHFVGIFDRDGHLETLLSVNETADTNDFAVFEKGEASADIPTHLVHSPGQTVTNNVHKFKFNLLLFLVDSLDVLKGLADGDIFDDVACWIICLIPSGLHNGFALGVFSLVLASLDCQSVSHHNCEIHEDESPIALETVNEQEIGRAHV